MIKKTYFKTKDYCKVKFEFNTKHAETVQIFGLKGDWVNSISMKRKKDGTFSCEVSLPKESRHEFKYLVNATDWISDHEADEIAPNEYGGTNSVVIL